MFYIFYGQDDFSLHQAVEAIKNSLGDQEMLAVNTSSLDGQHLTLNELRDKCAAAPFLSLYRLVIVDGLLQRFEPKRGKQRAGKHVTTESQGGLREWQDMVSYIEQMPATTILVLIDLIDSKKSSNNPLLKKLSPLAEVKTFPLLRDKDLKTWIRQQVVTNEGGSITPQAVNLLAELVGGNLWVMSNEIQKLLLYAQERSINEDDIRQLVSYTQEASIFPLVDAVLEGQTRIAQRILHQLYQEGASPAYILVMITRQFRLIALARGLDSGLSRLQIQNRLGMSGYGLDKTLRQAKLYDFEHIRHAYAKLLETDIAIKTGKYNDKLALELLVAELTKP